MSTTSDSARPVPAAFPHTLAQRLTLSLFLLIVGGGYVTAFLMIVSTTTATDGEPGMSATDVLYKYHGDRSTTPVARVLATRAMPPEDAPSQPTDPERQQLIDYSLGADKSPQTFEAPGVTGQSPAALLGAYCSECHSGSYAEGGVHFGPHKGDIEFEAVAPYLDPDTGLANLLSLTHTHLLGMGTFLFLVAGTFVYTTRYRASLKLVLGALPLLAIAGDIGGWWLTHWFGSPFQYLVLTAGFVMGTSLAAIIGLTLLDYWRGQPSIPGAEPTAASAAEPA